MNKHSSSRIRFVSLMFAGLLPVIALYSCSSSTAKDASPGKDKSFPVVTVVEKDTTLELEYIANIEARKNIEIHARVGGVLEQIFVDEGQMVQKGQLLFSINDDELKIALSKAGAALNSAIADARIAQVEKERIKKLVEKKIISPTELDLADARLNSQKAKIEEARSEKSAVEKRLSYTRIYSPFSGVIDRLPLKSGSLLTEGSLLTTISDISSVYAYFNISENEYLKLMRNGQQDSLGTEVRLVLADGSRYPFEGQIEASESEIDERTGSIAFRADFPNPRGILKHGASATLSITKPVGRVLMVPQKSVLEIQDRNYVYILDANNVVKMQNFKPAQRINGYYIVREGLQANDRIVYEGIQSIRDGQKINPVLTGAI